MAPVPVLTRLCTLTALLVAAPLAGQSEAEAGASEFSDELIHSDLPLYTFEWEELWPRNFRDEDSFGCASRVAFGDWKFHPGRANEYSSAYWIRIDNYGVFHCAANFYTADARDELADGEFERGFFVNIGESTRGSEPWELWVLQQGTVPGSSYVLLARQPDEPGIIDNFRILQRHCPEGHVRKVDGVGLDVWSSRYCAINSHSELLELASRMLRLPPLGVLERIGDPPGENGESTAADDSPSASPE